MIPGGLQLTTTLQNRIHKLGTFFPRGHAVSDDRDEQRTLETFRLELAIDQRLEDLRPQVRANLSLAIGLPRH